MAASYVRAGRASSASMAILQVPQGRSALIPWDEAGSALLTRREQRGADGAAEIAERGEPDRRRGVVGGEGREHRLADPLRVGLTELEPEAAADDDGLDVEHVAA